MKKLTKWIVLVSVVLLVVLYKVSLGPIMIDEYQADILGGCEIEVKDISEDKKMKTHSGVLLANNRGFSILKIKDFDFETNGWSKDYTIDYKVSLIKRPKVSIFTIDKEKLNLDWPIKAGDLREMNGKYVVAKLEVGDLLIRDTSFIGLNQYYYDSLKTLVDKN